jgi:hypothetical protein
MTAREREDLLLQMHEQLKHISERSVKTLNQVEKTNGRVSKLERWRDYLVGGGIVVVTVISWIVSTLGR